MQRKIGERLGHRLKTTKSMFHKIHNLSIRIYNDVNIKEIPINLEMKMQMLL